MDISKFIRGVPDFPKKGILFYDITPLMLNSEAYSQAIDEMAAKISETNPTKILAAESRGFFFGPMIALRLKLPFVPVRKKNKLPRKTICVEYALEYGTDALCIHDDAVSSTILISAVNNMPKSVDAYAAMRLAVTIPTVSSISENTVPANPM